MPILEAAREKIPPSFEVMAHDLSVKAGNLIDPSPSMLADMVPPPGSEDRPAPDSDNGIHVVTAEELPQVAQSLAEAFEHDPHFSYMIRDEDKKLSRLGHGILSFIKHEWLPNGVVHTNEQRSGAAAWTDQGNWKASLATMARIAKSLIGVITPAEAARLRRVLDFTEDKHGEIEHRWRLHRYLAMVGLSPDWQGMGWGDALMKVVLDECDAKGEAAYLEASTPQSIPLYERNGFEVIAWGRYMGATEDLHFMWREPQPE